MSAILREDPPDLSATNKNVQPGLERVVRHCLEKSPEERFHSAHDLAFDLESLSGTSRSAITARPAAASRFRPLPLLAGALAAARSFLRPATSWASRRAISEPPSFKQLTYPQRSDLGRALRLRRQDHPDDGGLGRKAGRDLRQPARQPGVAAVRNSGRRPRRRLVVRRRGGPPRSGLRHGVHASRDPRPRQRDRRGPASSPRERSTTPTGLPTARNSPSCGSRRGSAGSSFLRGRCCSSRPVGSGTLAYRRTATGSPSWTMVRSTTTAARSPLSISPGKRRRFRRSTRRRAVSRGRPTVRRSGTRRPRPGAIASSTAPRCRARPERSPASPDR